MKKLSVKEVECRCICHCPGKDCPSCMHDPECKHCIPSETNESPVESVSQPKASDGYLKEFLELLHDPSKDDVDLLDFIDETIEEERQRVIEMIEKRLSTCKQPVGYSCEYCSGLHDIKSDLQSKLGEDHVK